ncbi:MAG TPA: NADH-quinone oxidoreductase subunit N [Humisphaera sp.]
MPTAPYIPAWPDLRPFSADLWIVVTAVAVLLTPFFVRRPNTAAGTVTFVGLLVALASHLLVGRTDPAAGRFAPMLSADGVAFLWKALLLLFTLGAVLLWFASGRHGTREGDGPEFFVLLTCATLGMSLMAAASNLLMVFLAVELASLPSYVLAGFRKGHRRGAEASLKYVLFGAAATSVMVWGLSLLYGTCGTLNLYATVAADGTRLPGVAGMIAAQPAASAYVLVGLGCVLVGVAFKIAAAPFHLWCPDVFEGATVDVTTFLSVASKGAGLLLLVRLAVAVGEAANFSGTTVTTALAAVIGVAGAVTATVGNTAAYAQTNLKRLLAYSSIAHAGYMTCAAALIVRGHGVGAADLRTEAARVLLFYLAVYLFMNLGAFAVAAVVARRAGGDETLAAFRGLGRRWPVPAAAMTVCLFSLIGVPPLAGFTAKFNLMAALGGAGGWGWALVAAVAVNTVLSIYYYAKVVRAMYLDEGPAPAAAVTAYDRLGVGIAVASAAMLVAMFVGSNPVARMAEANGTLRSAATPAVAAAPK